MTQCDSMMMIAKWKIIKDYICIKINIMDNKKRFLQFKLFVSFQHETYIMSENKNTEIHVVIVKSQLLK